MSAHDRTIAALLGPRAPEVDCDACFALLDAYVDAVVAGEDPHDTDPRLHAHLQGCPVCHEEFESLHALVTSVDVPGGG